VRQPPELPVARQLRPSRPLSLARGDSAYSAAYFRTDTDSVTVRDVTRADGMIAALALDHAARSAGREYARMAREDGMTWAEIGMLLGLDVGTGDEATAAQTAFTYAAGLRAAADGPRMVAWQCPACRAVISDRGTSAGMPKTAGGCWLSMRILAASTGTAFLAARGDLMASLSQAGRNRESLPA
jgi:hypothetical protein